MQLRVQAFLFDLDKARMQIQRITSTGQLSPVEEAKLSCVNDKAFSQHTTEFMKSEKFDAMLRIRPVNPLQADIVMEAKEVLELLNSAYVGAYDLFEHNMRNASVRHLEQMIACMASVLDFLPKFIENRSRSLRTTDRPVYVIAGHGGLCDLAEFTIPRGCTVVVLAPPGGYQFADIAKKLDGFMKKFDASFVQKVRNQSSDFGYYVAYYNEGSIMQDQVVEFSGYGAATPSRDVLVSGLFKIPFERFRTPKTLDDGEGPIRISSLVGSQGPGIYVVQSCRVAETPGSFAETLQRDRRIQKNRRLPPHLNICDRDVNLQRCMAMSQYGRI